MRKIFLTTIATLFLPTLSAEAQTRQVETVDMMPTQAYTAKIHEEPWKEKPSKDSTLHDGENAFHIDVQVRGRGEYRNGYSTLRSEGDLPAMFVNERTRLSLGFEQKYISLKVSAQHTGVWGDTDLDNSTKGNFSLYEGWACLRSKQGLFLQAGRMALSYDDERVFGKNDWSATGRSHDGVRLGYEGKRHRVHTILAFNQAEERIIGGTYYNSIATYKNMQALWYNYNNSKHTFQSSVTFINQGEESGYATTLPSTNYNQTYGMWLQYKNRSFLFKVDGYYQMGYDQKGYKMDAYLAGLRIGYLHPIWNVELGADMLSGNNRNLATHSPFNLLYGSSHEFFGAMDYFTNDNMLFCGLIDPEIKASVNPTKNLNIDVAYHYFMTQKPLTGLHRQLGQEVDLHANWNIIKDVQLEAGYSIMMATSVLKYLKGGNNKSWQDWGWLSLNVNMEAFSTHFKSKKH